MLIYLSRDSGTKRRKAVCCLFLLRSRDFPSDTRTAGRSCTRAFQQSNWGRPAFTGSRARVPDNHGWIMCSRAARLESRQHDHQLPAYLAVDEFVLLVSRKLPRRYIVNRFPTWNSNPHTICIGSPWRSRALYSLSTYDYYYFIFWWSFVSGGAWKGEGLDHYGFIHERAFWYNYINRSHQPVS